MEMQDQGLQPQAQPESLESVVGEVSAALAKLMELVGDDQKAEVEAMQASLAGLSGEKQAEPELSKVSAMGGPKGVPVV